MAIIDGFGNSEQHRDTPSKSLANLGESPEANPILIVSRRDPIQTKIEVLVAALQRSSQAAPRLFRRLCLLAVQSHPESQDATVPLRQDVQRQLAEDFRGRLVRAGLAEPRASEIKSVLQLDDTPLQAFIHGPATWKNTLEAARTKADKDRGFEPLNQLAAELVGRMHEQGIERVTFRNRTRTFILERRMIPVVKRAKRTSVT